MIGDWHGSTDSQQDTWQDSQAGSAQGHTQGMAGSGVGGEAQGLLGEMGAVTGLVHSNASTGVRRAGGGRVRPRPRRDVGVGRKSEGGGRVDKQGGLQVARPLQDALCDKRFREVRTDGGHRVGVARRRHGSR